MQSQAQNFFNLHLSGIGYLNRVRWVEPKGQGRRAEPFLACSVSAMRGNSDHPDYTPLDLRVSGEEAIEMIASLQKDVDDKRKVVISFRAGDLYPHLYERNVRDPQTRQPTGEREMACLIKGRLLLVNSITIDGERVFTRDAEGEAADPASEPDDAAPAASHQAAPEPAPAQAEREPAEAMQRTGTQRNAGFERKPANDRREFVPANAQQRERSDERRAAVRQNAYAAGRKFARVAQAMS